jgi:AraC family carnitine catabolism transcriptional activator
MMGFVSAVEPLRVANRFRPNAYRWQILSWDGAPVVASNGMSLNVDGPLSQADAAKILFVVAGFNPLQYYQRALGHWLRRWDQRGAILGAIDTGAFILAQAQLLRDHVVTLHWEAQPAFAERFPTLQVSQELYEWGGRRISCAGGTAAIDMMLALIGQTHGLELAAMVSEQFVHGPMRDSSQHQRSQVTARYGVHNKKLVQVIRTMETSLEEPIPLDALAAAVHVTRRQLERLFKTHLHATPVQFYLGLRLERAQKLLRQTEMDIGDVGLACGFTTASYFSRAYRLQFGTSPKNDRTTCGT